MKVKIKKLHPNAVIPSYAKEGDAGLDLTATSKTMDERGNTVYGTGLAFEIPRGYVGLVFPRSSNANTNLTLTNSVGVIDSGYRGEVMFKYKPLTQSFNPLKVWWDFCVRKKTNAPIRINQHIMNGYEVGDRIGQLIIMKHPVIELVEVNELSDTERGTGGYGSSGK